jgi:hypothetical protein
VVVRFVDIGGIGDLHFLIVTFQVTKQPYYNMYETYNIVIDTFHETQSRLRHMGLGIQVLVCGRQLKVAGILK